MATIVHGAAALALAALVALTAGCASAPTHPRIGQGAQEYRQLTIDSLGAVHAALRALDRVAGQTNRLSAGIVADFSHEVEQLQIESFRVRSRTQAIQARGEAYFQAWSANPPVTNSSPTGKQAEYLSKMGEAFVQIKLASQQTGEAFRPFLSGLRKLSVQFETQTNALETADTRQLITTTREQGLQVVQRLEVLQSELQDIIPVLTRAKAEANL
jgi:hypothetical protein